MKSNIKLFLTLFITVFLLNTLKAQNSSVSFEIINDSIIRPYKNDTSCFNYLQCRYKNKEIQKKFNSLFILTRIDYGILLFDIDRIYNNTRRYSTTDLLQEVKDSIKTHKYSEPIDDCKYEISFNKYEVASIINNYYWKEYDFTYPINYNLDFITGTYLSIEQIFNLKKLTKVSNLLGKTLTKEIKKNKLDTNDPIIKHFIARCKKGFDQWDMYFFYFKTNKDGKDGINFYFLNYTNCNTKSKYKHKMDIFIPFKKLKPYMTDRFRKRVFGK